MRHQGEILEEHRRLSGGRFTDSMGRRIQSTYQREFSEHLRKNLEELANRNEEFQKFLKNSHVTTQELAIKLSAPGGVKELLKLLGMKAGAGFREQGMGEKGERNVQSLTYQLRNVIAQSATEAAEATMSEMENAGYSVDAVREYMRNAGARHLATWTEMEQLRETIGTGATREINVDFLKFVARKEGVPEGKAFFEIAEDPQKFEEYKAEFLNEMSRNPDWMKKYYEKKNELEGEIKGVQGQVDQGAAEAYEKARSFRPSTSHMDEMAERFKTGYNLNPRDTWAYVEKERSKNLLFYGIGKVPFLGQVVKDVSTVAYNVAKGAIPPEPGEKLLRPDRNVIRGRIILPERK